MRRTKNECKTGEETADVQNLTEQVLMLFGLEVDFKVARMEGIDKTLQRIRGEGNTCDTN